MKFNTWTVGLTVAGAFLLVPVSRAQEAAANAVQTKLATTSLSGYISTTYQWNMGNDPDGTTVYNYGGDKSDRFALDVVSLTLASPMGAGDWASGYKVQLWAGPDASSLISGSSGDLAVKAAYVELRVPVGKGINLELGRYDTFTGYEYTDYTLNPFFTHGWGWYIEQTIHTGLKASYQLAQEVKIQAMLANTTYADDNVAIKGGRRKAYGGILTVGAPASFGFLADAELSFCYINGYNPSDTSVPLQSFYFGGVIPTPIKKLSSGISWNMRKDGGGDGQSTTIFTLYLQYKATNKLTFNLRGERLEGGPAIDINPDSAGTQQSAGWDSTLGVAYSLWPGVLTRLEWRYTQFDDPGTVDQDSNSIFLNVIYEF